MESTIRAKLSTAKGFTLIELLIVIAIIGILTMAILPTIRSAQSRSRDAVRFATVNNLNVGLSSLIANAGVPGGAGTKYCMGGSATAASGPVAATAWGNSAEPSATLSRILSFTSSSSTALGTIASADLCNGDGIYFYPISTTSYILGVQLENPNSANVKAGTVVAGITAATTVTAATTLQGAPGVGNDKGLFYYVVAQ